VSRYGVRVSVKPSLPALSEFFCILAKDTSKIA
jgi:hypothetical protein